MSGSNVMPLTASRGVVSWGQDRWSWKRGVRKDCRLNDAAKVLASALCDDWANHETGFCNPSVATLASALGKSARSIQRSIAALREAGWLDTVVRGRGDRGGAGKAHQGSEFVFLCPATSPQKEAEPQPIGTREKVTHLAPYRDRAATQRVTPVTVKGDTRVVLPHTPYKDKPNINQTAKPQSMNPVAVDGAGAERWDAWLKRHSFPPLSHLAERVSFAGEDVWLLPIRCPPAEGNGVGEAMMRRWIDDREKVQ